MDLNHNQDSEINQILHPNERTPDVIVNELRKAIDQPCESFGKTKSLILDLARVLDERKQCEQNDICRTIKEILKEKIAEDKITARWIEECLPQEYKRKYTKCEQNSLLDNGNQSAAKITLNNKGEAITDSQSYRESREEITPTKRIAEHQGTSENDKHGYTKCLELEEGAS